MKTLAYATVIAAVLGVLGWNKFQEYWGRRHEILGQTIRQQLELFAPEWEVTFDSAELKDDATVVLTNVAVGVRGRSEPLLDLREIEINLDRSLITNQQQAFPTKVVLRHPRVLVERGPDGFWNWENIPRIPQSDNPIPVIELEQGTLFLQVAAHDMLPSTEFAIQQIHIEVTPTGFRELSIRGESALDVVGSLEFQGGVNLNNGYWHVAGICPELREAGRLVGLATGISPQAQSRFDLIAQSTARGRSSSDSTAPGGLPPKPIQTVGAATIDEFGGMSHANGVGTSPLFTIPQLGVSANVAVAFHVSSEGPDSWVQYQVQTRIKDGIIDNPALPIPLQNLSGEVYVDNSQIVLKEVRARNGDSDLFLDGTIPQSQPPEAMQGVTQGVSQSTSQGTKPGTTSFLMQAKNLAFDRQMRSLLPVGMLKLYDSLQPAGRFDIDASYVDDGKSAPKLTLREFIARDCSVLPEAFQYPVTQVQAKVWQEGDLFQVTGTGVCAGQTCTAAGWFRDPGPRVQASLVLRGQNLPINEQSIAALKLPSQQGARTTLERMQLRGLADAELVLTKTGIEGEKMKMTLNGVVHDASLNYQLFPYAITGFSGRVSVDPLSPDPAQRDVWHFTEMTGRHGDAALQAEAHLGTVGGRKVLNMQVSATAVPIDRELHTACVTASPAMQEVFSSLMEGGQLDAQGINIVWSPGVPLSISVPSLIATNARV
ncbi:MAG: hypothetical protein R3C01_15720, partial [Planctomycetaceae bacterium]